MLKTLEIEQEFLSQPLKEITTKRDYLVPSVGAMVGSTGYIFPSGPLIASFTRFSVIAANNLLDCVGTLVQLHELVIPQTQPSVETLMTPAEELWV